MACFQALSNAPSMDAFIFGKVTLLHMYLLIPVPISKELLSFVPNVTAQAFWSVFYFFHMCCICWSSCWFSLGCCLGTLFRYTTDCILSGFNYQIIQFLFDCIIWCFCVFMFTCVLMIACLRRSIRKEKARQFLSIQIFQLIQPDCLKSNQYTVYLFYTAYVCLKLYISKIGYDLTYSFQEIWYESCNGTFDGSYVFRVNKWLAVDSCGVDLLWFISFCKVLKCSTVPRWWRCYSTR